MVRSIVAMKQVEVTYWDEEKFNQRIFTNEGNDEMTQAAAASHGNGL